MIIGLSILSLVIGFVTFGFLQPILFRQPLNIAARPKYQGMTLQAVKLELGQPVFTRQMTVAEAVLLPFRGGFISKIYSCEDPGEAAVQIRELTWKRRETYVTVWFHQIGGHWAGLDGVEWHRRMLQTAELQPPTTNVGAATQP